MDAGAAVFAELAPRSGRFAAGALLRLLDQVDAVTAGVTGLHEVLLAAREELAASIDRVAERVDALDPKVDRVLELAERAHLGGDAVAASRWATEQGVVLGPPLAGWEPERLGVHASITVHDETSLTPYIRREHDTRLRDLLTELHQPGSRAALLLVSGTSCTGKTRTLYEAVREVLPDWPLVAPRNDTELTDLLRAGVPDGTVVWLDEIQRHLTKTADGISAAKAIAELIGSDQVGPILFAGTIWPSNLATLLGRPTPEEGSRRGRRHPRPAQARTRHRRPGGVHRRSTSTTPAKPATRAWQGDRHRHRDHRPRHRAARSPRSWPAEPSS